ncbi:MAG: ferredoxin [Deltaproteobacteria bacterium]|nr:MAG: ferredoxin [Deltaproteobacteria bacterium]
MGEVRVRLDEDACVGHGRCYEMAPEVYGEDERGHCRIEREEVPPELEEAAQIGADNCPERAISIERGARPRARED